MNKKEYCLTYPAIAYYSGWGGIEIHGFEYGIDDYVYYVSSAWYGGEKAKRYHKCKIYSTAYGLHYFMYNGNRIPLGDCIRMGV